MVCTRLCCPVCCLVNVDRVGRLNHRLNAMLFKCRFSDLCNDLQTRLGTLSHVVDAVKSSMGLKSALEYLLAIGAVCLYWVV